MQFMGTLTRSVSIPDMALLNMFTDRRRPMVDLPPIERAKFMQIGMASNGTDGATDDDRRSYPSRMKRPSTSGSASGMKGRGSTPGGKKVMGYFKDTFL